MSPLRCLRGDPPRGGNAGESGGTGYPTRRSVMDDATQQRQLRNEVEQSRQLQSETGSSRWFSYLTVFLPDMAMEDWYRPASARFASR
jgi:hypothetical protein